jgi:nicotinamide-nucleotide amidase
MSLGDPSQRIVQLSADLGRALVAQHLTLATAESCTAGGVAYAVTLSPGASLWFDRGFITYANDSKMQVLGVAPAYLRDFGAVSEPVARAMALGALSHSSAQVAVAITGVAGPGGGTDTKPVGTVCFAWAIRRDPSQPAWVRTETRQFEGDRNTVRTQSIVNALESLVGLLKQRQDV